MDAYNFYVGDYRSHGWAGQDSKLVQNSTSTRSKQSNVDEIVNQAILLIFATLAFLAAASTVLSAVWLQTYSKSWYLPAAMLLCLEDPCGIDFKRSFLRH